MRKSLTHFETIPVAVVRKIAKPLPRDEVEAQSSHHDGHPLLLRPGCSAQSFPERETEMGDSKENDAEQSNEDWRDLALRVQQETDPNKMIELAVQLVAKLDEKEAAKNLPPKPPTESPETS